MMGATNSQAKNVVSWLPGGGLEVVAAIAVVVNLCLSWLCAQETMGTREGKINDKMTFWLGATRLPYRHSRAS